MYALLSGSLPFDHENQRETIRMTLEEQLVFDLSVWKNVSLLCKDLLTKLLTKEPEQRISLSGAINHKFFDSVRLEFGKTSPV